MTTDEQRARQSRQAAVVCAVAAVLWMGAQLLGPALGLPGHYSILFDLIALAAFAWAMIVTYRLRRTLPVRPTKDKQG